MKSRVVILVVAVLLGIVAAVVAAKYLGDASAKLTSEAEPVKVLVAVKDVPQGTTAEDALSDGYVELREVPRRYVAEGAVSSASAISGQVLATSLSTGEQVTAARFKYASEVGLAYGIPEGFVAMSVAADDVKCVGGMLKPGDYVMITATLDPGPANAGPETRVLLKKVLVLAVGTTMGNEQATTTEEGSSSSSLTGNASNTDTAQSLTLTLALLPSDVEKLVYAEEEGTTRLALLPATATSVVPTPGRTLSTIFR